MKISKTTSLSELATIISEALDEAGVTAVLSGGAAVSIYTSNKYQSKDLDFVTSADISSLLEILEPLGFTRGSDRRHLVHPNSEWFIEFPPGPVEIGNAVINDWIQMDTGYGTLLILSPTQMVMDRLAAFFHWNDPQSLEQARMIVRENEIDWAALEAWAEDEGAMDKYKYFRSSV